MGFIDIIKSIEIAFGTANVDKNGNPRPGGIRKPFETPGDGKKLIDDIVKEGVKHAQKRRDK